MYEGDKIAQLYMHDVLASYTRPVKGLKAFQRVHLDSGEIKTVTFTLPASRLGYFLGSSS